MTEVKTTPIKEIATPLTTNSFMRPTRANQVFHRIKRDGKAIVITLKGKIQFNIQDKYDPYWDAQEINTEDRISVDSIIGYSFIYDNNEEMHRFNIIGHDTEIYFNTEKDKDIFREKWIALVGF